MSKRIASLLAFSVALGVASPASAEIASGPAVAEPSPSAVVVTRPPSYAAPPSYAPPPATPAAAYEPVVMRKRRSEPAFHMGTGLVVVGGVSFVVGLGALLVAASDGVQHIECLGDPHCTEGSSAAAKVGLGFLAGGLVAAAVGVPLLIYGGQKVARPFSWAPRPGGTGLVWRF